MTVKDKDAMLNALLDVGAALSGLVTAVEEVDGYVDRLIDVVKNMDTDKAPVKTAEAVEQTCMFDNTQQETVPPDILETISIIELYGLNVDLNNSDKKAQRFVRNVSVWNSVRLKIGNDAFQKACEIIVLAWSGSKESMLDYTIKGVGNFVFSVKEFDKTRLIKSIRTMDAKVLKDKAKAKYGNVYIPDLIVLYMIDLYNAQSKSGKLEYPSFVKKYLKGVTT